MITLRLDTKKCMAQLLLRDTFDSFSFIEGEITTFNRFSFDGRIQKDFFEEAPDREYALWKEIREYCFSMIKGKRTPLSFRLIFSLTPDQIARLITEKNLDFQPSSIQGLYLNFKFDGTLLQCITGTSMHIFTMDKSLEHAWDKWVQGFFDQCDIPFDM